MQKLVGVRFKPAGKIYYFDPHKIYLSIDDHVIVETARGLEYGYVATKVSYAEETELKHPLKPVVRKATQEDTQQHQDNLLKTDEAMKLCKEQINKHELDMKLIRAEYTFDATKVIFYFTADGRVDFRELVKDLASIFRIRIELRQIGVRDEAKMIGGMGCCGRALCCNKWLSEFQPVSIKMAKEQGLSLNPGKISGICGRLLCCLQYEHETYEEILKQMPESGDEVNTPDGSATVLKPLVLKESVQVKMKTDEHVIKEFAIDEITPINQKKKKPSKKNVKMNDNAKDSEQKQNDSSTEQNNTESKLDESI